jgi:WD40 repeat protein
VFLPRERTLLTAARTGKGDQVEIRRTDTSAGKPVSQPLLVKGSAGIALSPDGSRLLTADDRDSARPEPARLWDTATGALLWEVADATMPFLLSIDSPFSPDGRYVLLEERSGALRLRDVQTGTAVGALMRGFPNPLFSPNGRILLTTTREESLLREVATGRLLGEFTRHGYIDETHREFSADSRFIVAYMTEGVRLWDAAVAKPVGVAQSSARALAFSRRGQVLRWEDGQKAWLQQLPRELDGEIKRLVLWVEVNTCQELNATGAIVDLDEAAWQQRYERLQTLGSSPRQRFALQPPESKPVPDYRKLEPP